MTRAEIEKGIKEEAESVKVDMAYLKRMNASIILRSATVRNALTEMLDNLARIKVLALELYESEHVVYSVDDGYNVSFREA